MLVGIEASQHDFRFCFSGFTLIAHFELKQLPFLSLSAFSLHFAFLILCAHDLYYFLSFSFVGVTKCKRAMLGTYFAPHR